MNKGFIGSVCVAIMLLIYSLFYNAFWEMLAAILTVYFIAMIIIVMIKPFAR